MPKWEYMRARVLIYPNYTQVHQKRRVLELRGFEMHKKLKSILGVIPLLIGLSLIGVSIITISYLTSSASYYPENIAGLDILHDGNGDPEVFVGLVPLHGTQEVYATIFISDWEKSLTNCSQIQVYFPGVTYHHSYLLESELPVPETPALWGEAWPKLLYNESRHPLSSKMELAWVREPWLCQDIIKIHPKQIEDFVGGIEFLWRNGLQKLSFTEVCFILPFQAPHSQGVQLNTIRKYQVQLWSPIDYELISSIPKPSRFQLFGRRGALYQFDIDVQKSDLVVIFEDRKQASIRNYLLIIFSTLLGIGLTIVVGEVISTIKARRTAR